MEEGEREGMKSAEVGRPAATCPTTEDGAGELEADGGNVTQAPPLLFLFQECFSAAPVHLRPHAPMSYPSSLPLSFVSHFSHLTSNLTPNNKISFTSNSSPTYMKVKRSGATSMC